MRYLKKINEVFDSEELKSSMEIPYLKGDFDPQKILKWWIPVTSSDKNIRELLYSCPFLSELNYYEKDGILNIGISGGNGPYTYMFSISIFKGMDVWYVRFTELIRKNGSDILLEGDQVKIEGSSKFKKLADIINGEGFDRLTRFNFVLGKIVGISIFSGTRHINPSNN
jgi:hypothetical protein